MAEERKPPTWSAVQGWLYGQEDYRERFRDDERFRDLDWELDVIRKLIRLTEIVQLLGPQFLQLMKRNETMLSKPKPRAKPADDGGRQDGDADKPSAD